jgi:hypothetical protein
MTSSLPSGSNVEIAEAVVGVSPQHHHQFALGNVASSDISALVEQPSVEGRHTSAGRELRRARIVITVKRTESYKQWLDENPLQSVLAEDDDVDDVDAEDTIDVVAGTEVLQDER